MSFKNLSGQPAECFPAIKWTSASNPSGNCVEVGRLDADSVALRDSKNPGGPVHVFTRSEWGAFITGAKTGRFDDI
jgi:hypothetical protein